MTYKEMVKKINTYNEIAEMIGNEKAELRVQFDGYGYSEKVEDAKSFRKLITENYIDCCAKAILNYSEYEFNKQAELSCTDSCGTEFTVKIEFWAE